MDQGTAFVIRELLCDLGWLPSDLNCAEKKHLADEYLTATIAWFEAARGPQLMMLEQLRRAYKASQPTQYETLNAAIDGARLKAARTRMELEAHVADHNC